MVTTMRDKVHTARNYSANYDTLVSSNDLVPLSQQLFFLMQHTSEDGSASHAEGRNPLISLRMVSVRRSQTALHYDRQFLQLNTVHLSIYMYHQIECLYFIHA